MIQNPFLQAVLGLDNTVLSAVPDIQSLFITKIVLFITALGDPLSILFISCAVILIFWFFNTKSHALQLLLSMMVASGTILTLKYIVQRARPEYGLIAETGYSFPSGHALAAAVFFPVLIYIVKGYIKRPIYKALYIVGMVIFMLLIGFSRLYLGVHYLSDVVAGILIGLIISAVSILVAEAYQSRKVR